MPSIDLMGMLYTLPALLIGLTLHELAHGWVAYKMGDPTAKNLGRLTLNPLKHLDPLGTFFLLFFNFGWAKPVPVNPMNFAGDRKRGMLWVSLAGPGTNLIIVILTALVWKFIQPQGYTQTVILFYIYYINLILAVFNFIPVPPLDGSKIFAGFLPAKYGYVMYSVEKYGMVILLLLSFTGIIGKVLIPAVRLLGAVIASLLGVDSLQAIISQ